MNTRARHTESYHAYIIEDIYVIINSQFFSGYVQNEVG